MVRIRGDDSLNASCLRTNRFILLIRQAPISHRWGADRSGDAFADQSTALKNSANAQDKPPPNRYLSWTPKNAATEIACIAMVKRAFKHPSVTWVEQLFQREGGREEPMRAPTGGRRVWISGLVRSDRGQVDGLSVLPAAPTPPASEASRDPAAEA